jgi:hypothetical protein
LRELVARQEITPGDAAGLERGWRRDFRALDRILRRGEQGKGSVDDPLESMSLLESLIRSGAVQVGPDWSHTLIEAPGGENARRRFVALVDYYRDQGYQTEIRQGGYQNPPSGVPMPTPGYPTATPPAQRYEEWVKQHSP